MRLDLARIERSLRGVGEAFDDINAQAGAIRDPLDEHTIQNMLEGYRYVDALVGQRADLFALGESQQLLELNRIVLCGVDAQLREEHRGHLAASELRYYEEPNAGIGDLAEWYKLNANESVHDRAAGAYVRMLASPQLFIEGNHRTGALLMAYILMLEGKPPFVLSRENAFECFTASSAIRGMRKNGMSDFLQLASARRRIAELLGRDADARYLKDETMSDSAPVAGRAAS